MSDGIEKWLSTWQRTETRELVRVTSDNVMELAAALGGTIDFEEAVPRVTMNGGRRFSVGDLIDRIGSRMSMLGSDWVPVERGDTINGDDLR